MAYFDGTANYIVFQFLKKTAQHQSVQNSNVCQTEDEDEAFRQRMLQALANWVLEKLRSSLFFRPDETLSAEKSETWINFSDGGSVNFATGECRLGFCKERLIEYLRFLFIWVQIQTINI